MYDNFDEAALKYGTICLPQMNVECCIGSCEIYLFTL